MPTPNVGPADPQPTEHRLNLSADQRADFEPLTAAANQAQAERDRGARLLGVPRAALGWAYSDGVLTWTMPDEVSQTGPPAEG
jgi:hypothetical protein